MVFEEVVSDKTISYRSQDKIRRSWDAGEPRESRCGLSDKIQRSGHERDELCDHIHDVVALKAVHHPCNAWYVRAVIRCCTIKEIVLSCGL
jgi:hypothetical protein